MVGARHAFENFRVKRFPKLTGAREHEFERHNRQMLQVVIERRDLKPLPYRQCFGGSELPNPINQITLQVTQLVSFNSMVELATDYDMSGSRIGIDLGK